MRVFHVTPMGVVMNIEDVNGSVSFEETEKGVKMFIRFSHPTKSTESGFPLTMQCDFEFDAESNYFRSLESFFE